MTCKASHSIGLERSFAPLLSVFLSGVITLLALALFGAQQQALAAEPKLVLRDPKLAEMRPGELRPLYLIIENNGLEGDRLLRVSSPRFGEAVMLSWRRLPLSALELPAGEERAIGPRGDAVLIIGAADSPWVEGETATLEFVFEQSGAIQLPLRAGPRPSGQAALTLSERSRAPVSSQGYGNSPAQPEYVPTAPLE